LSSRKEFGKKRKANIMRILEVEMSSLFFRSFLRKLQETSVSGTGQEAGFNRC